MRRSQFRATIRPKISTMPRKKSEAAAFLDIYKLVVEKKRLQEELEGMDERRWQICDRIAVLTTQIASLEGSVQALRAEEAAAQPAATADPSSGSSSGLLPAFAPRPRPIAPPPKSSGGHDTFYLDY